jgi:predicted dehydrogenase
MTMRIAVVGCGLIAQRSHIPAVLHQPRARLSVLCDQSRERAESLRRELGVACDVTSSVEEIKGRADAAIVATPNASHADLTSRLLRQGLHVLCEKPLALSVAEAEQVLAVADATGRVLGVGFVHRFHETTRLLRAVIDDGLIGEVRRYDLQLGVKFEWAAVSQFYFDRQLAGGGVLISEGVHWLDRLVHWFGPARVTRALDNNQGGIETDIELAVSHDAHGGVHGTARFSWLYELRNSLHVIGTDGYAVVGKDDRSHVAVHRFDRPAFRWDVRLAAPVERLPQAYFGLQLEDFLDAIADRRPPVGSGRDALGSVDVVEQAYRLVEPQTHAWAVVAP